MGENRRKKVASGSARGDGWATTAKISPKS